MSEPIKKKLGEIAAAPTPQNTPASLSGSYMSKLTKPTIPNTISEDKEELQKKLLLNNPALLSMIEGKLNTLVGEDSGYVEKLPKKLKIGQFDIEAEFQQELLELERKYHGKYKPLYIKRHNIIIGKEEPSAEEIEEGEQLIREEREEDEDEDGHDGKDDEDDEDDEEEEEVAKGIPGFWLTALENLGIVAETITEKDAEVLSKLTDIRMEYLDVPGFKLIFEFDENNFFTNKTLTKTYYYQKELGYSGDFIYDHAEGSQINWTSNDNNVTLIVERRKQRNKHTKQVRTIEKLSPVESFFNFFDPPKVPKSSKDKERDEEDEENTPDVEGANKEEDEDDELDEELEQRLELDYQIGEIIKDKLIPRAIDWFTGEAIKYEIQEGDYDDEDDDFGDDNDEDDEDDEDDDGASDESGDEELNKSKAQPPECKQS
ncbi:hypothetical protein PACTADRAFT_75928 [Pachysolen tannophilus NRRL Y-2460]|uniref:Nucleosome assembly protein n=1 Tax=Pachysolen tannophilus NRRL Y-2460 TaxID=669874 RepID=A0A1E4TUM9_PACTA|nr:hypothetical protein PACTADRAFT_75928 [Pachysolen tannophilus NRRL Y-2460]